MSFSLGFCGSFIRLILGIINFLFLLIGVAVFIAAAVLRWGSDSIIEEITKNDAVVSIINVSVIDGVSVALLSIGAFIILLSIIGLMGTIFKSKFFLYVYEFTIILLFLAHGITLIVVTLVRGSVEDQFKAALNTTMDNLNNATHDVKPDKFEIECAVMKGLSDIFQCCGSNDRSDFVEPSAATQCCMNNTSIGCGPKIIGTISNNVVDIVIIPNVTILVFELILILMVPLFVSRINKSKYKKDDRERLINDTYSETRYS